jgi:glycosyltransferase involved in cell wall biosynthesis
MPVRDAGEHLCVAVRSILAQSYADYELLIIDDHSRDGAISGLAPNPRIRVCDSRERGIVSALNSGLRLARGTLIARMDADDIAEPARLGAQLACLDRHRDVGLCGTGVEIFREQGPLRDGFRRYQNWLNALRTPADIEREIFVENPIPHPSLMARRDLLQRLDGYRDVP